MGMALEAGLSLSDFWISTPRTVVVAWRAYLRRRGWYVWHAGIGISPNRAKDMTYEKLTGQAQAHGRRAMSLDQMAANLGMGAAAHNAALAARAAR